VRTDYKEILQSKTVGIAGAGGLGSNCAIALARVGIGKLIICDFDIVSEGNLNRQYYFIKQIGFPKVMAIRDNINQVNPNVQVEIHHEKLDENLIISIFRDCDIIVEAFDLAEMKKMICETVLSKMPDKFIISGMGLGGWGNNNLIRTHQFDKLFICGDLETEVSEEYPPLAPRVGIVSSMQANLVLELLINQKNGNSA
jgi:sulfur carrier protein ThiS adenylyltransferase